MRSPGRSGLAVVIVWAAVWLPVAAFGQSATPHRARLTSVEGYVRIDHVGQPDNTAGDPGLPNLPLAEGQTVVTGEDGQAEVEFEDGSLARLTPNTAMTLSRLGGSSGTQLLLGKGLGYFELRAAAGIGYTVSAAGDRLHPTENATVRVNVDEPPAAIAVLDGTVRVERPGSYATDVRAGETFRADAVGGGRYFLTQEIVPDTWDAWNDTRDQQAADAASQQTDARAGYAGDQGYGWSDLDANGTWYDAGQQGQVWQPNGGNDPGFDPYANGSWVWNTGGYVWASAYPWGWTPFRCGSWGYTGGFGWGWAPAGNCGNFGGGYGVGGGYGGYGGYNGYGGGGYRGGNYVNVSTAPPGYPIHRPPSPTRGGLHPIVTVPGTSPRTAPTAPAGVRTINGIRATPLPRTAESYTARGGAATGAGLMRDYPINRATHAPVFGVRAGEGTSSSASALGSGSGYGIGQVSGGTIGQRVPMNGAQPATVYRPGQQGTYSRAPSPNGQPNGQPRGQQAPVRSSAPAAPSRPTYSAPPPASHASAPAASSGKK